MYHILGGDQDQNLASIYSVQKQRCKRDICGSHWGTDKDKNFLKYYTILSAITGTYKRQ